MSTSTVVHEIYHMRRLPGFGRVFAPNSFRRTLLPVLLLIFFGGTRPPVTVQRSRSHILPI